MKGDHEGRRRKRERKIGTKAGDVGAAVEKGVTKLKQHFKNSPAGCGRVLC